MTSAERMATLEAVDVLAPVKRPARVKSAATFGSALSARILGVEIGRPRHPQPRFGQERMKIPMLVMLTATCTIALSVAANADTVEDGEGVFARVTILKLDDDQLVFVFNDGRALQRAADGLKAVAVSDGNDPAADELTRAELLRLSGKRRDAIGLYGRAAQEGGKPWVRSYATMRLVRLYEESGDLWSSYLHYASLAGGHPRLAERLLPRRAPRADSKICRQIVSDIDQRLASRQSAELSEALLRYRATILREPLPKARLTTDEPAGPASDAPRPSDASPAANVRPSAEASVAESVNRARKALAEGDLGSASKVYEALSQRVGEARPPELLLLEAELGLARKQYRQAGVAALRLAVDYPQSVLVPEALFLAARSQEQLDRPGKAVDFYRRCALHPQVSPELKQQALDRVRELQAGSEAAQAPSSGDAR